MPREKTELFMAPPHSSTAGCCVVHGRWQATTRRAGQPPLKESYRGILTSHPGHTPIWAVNPDQEQSLDAESVLKRGVCLQSPNSTCTIDHSEMPVHIQGLVPSEREPTAAGRTDRLSLERELR